ncbi:Two component regulator propeller [Cyclonatronum proteinivorum]|uniref:Two component regulator propeller n=1 Tax=Cyclonatronum proteinivorum TaxID=1457365 RepID=A0A345UP87_9BACT|nr:histidine kinase [Cyclonatronum proteinivorum]AXJ02289.1 Two component regulator propeller [Cyclonatronum proteinivorum]
MKLPSVSSSAILHCLIRAVIVWLLYAVAAGAGHFFEVSPANAQISSPDNILPGTIVYDMVQDTSGNLWFGTESGLTRYDGHSFKRYTTADGLPGNSILQLGADASGRVWALDFTGSVSYVHRGVVHTPTTSALLRDAVVPNFVPTSIYTQADTVWVSWELNKVMRITPARADVMQLNKGSKDVSVRHMASDGRGNLLLATLDSLYTVPTPQLQMETSTQRSFSSGRPFSYKGVPFAPAGQQWRSMLTDERLNPQGLNIPAAWQGDDAISMRFPYPQIRGQMFSASETTDGYIAVGTTEGMFFIPPDPDAPLTEVLDGMFVNRVLTDKEGNIWASTLGSGVFKFPAGFWKIRGFNAADAGLPALRSVRIMGDGTVFYGTASEFFGRYGSEGLATDRLPQKFASRYGFQLLIIDEWGGDIVLASSSTLFIGNRHEDGTVDFENGQYLHLGGPKQLVIVSDTLMYVGASMGILKAERGASGEVKLEPLYTGRVTSLASHPEKGLIAGGAQGLWRLEEGELLPYQPALEKSQITDLKLLNQDSLLIATNGFGLWKLSLSENRLIRLFEEDERLLSIREFKIDEYGNWWLASSSGLFHYDPAAEVLSLRDTGNIRRLDVRSGSLAYLTSASAVMSDAASFPLPEIALQFNPPRLLADDILIPLIPASQPGAAAQDGKLLSYETASLPYRTRLLQLETSVPHFRTEGNIQYHFRLLPADQAWQATAVPDFSFRILRPGSYELSIRAEATGAQPSPELHIPFVIEAPFWQKSWFLGITMMGLIGLVMLGINIQLMRIERRERIKLEQYKKTVELEQQALTAMMNPHFIFNVLNAIRQYISTQQEGKADTYLQLFARLIRLQLEATFRKKITLKEEISLLEMYAELEMARLPQTVQFRISVDAELQDELDEIEIPPMLIQPFLENALLHGIKPGAKPGLVTLVFSLAGDSCLKVTLQDNGVGMASVSAQPAKDSKHTSLALTLIRQRLELMRPEIKPDEVLSISSTAGEGTSVSFEIPI